MSKTLYHGTTLANWERIQLEGWNGSSRQEVWNCSCNEVYFYDLDKAEQEPEYADDECIQRAFESAQTAAAVQGYTGESLVVIKIEIDDDYVEDDWSCENMNDVASVVQPEDLRQEHIVTVYQSDTYCPSLRLMYVAGFLQSNDYILRDGFSRIELTMAEKLSELFFDDLLEFDWREVDKAAC